MARSRCTRGSWGEGRGAAWPARRHRQSPAAFPHPSAARGSAQVAVYIITNHETVCTHKDIYWSSIYLTLTLPCLIHHITTCMVECYGSYAPTTQSDVDLEDAAHHQSMEPVDCVSGNLNILPRPYDMCSVLLICTRQYS